MFGKKKQDAERKPIEQEIAELQRKFRVLENDKRAYSEDSQAIIRKQRATIEKLTRENRQMKQDLNETRAVAASRSESKSSATKLQQIQENKEIVEQQLQHELERRTDANDRLENLRQTTKDVRQDLAKRGGVNAARENTEAISKQIRVLENRLDKSLQKFNEAIAYNKSLREQIDGLRRERVVFDSIYKKLEQELQVKKKEMANIIEISNSAYESRDQAQQEMQALKKQLEEEQAAFEEEWKDLGRIIEADRARKQNRKAAAEIEQRGEMTVEEEMGMKKKLIKGTWAIARDKASMHVQAEKVQTYEEAFARIMDATNIHSIDELVDTFINAEDKNFTLFNFVNELTSEIEKLEEQIQDIKAEVEKYRGQDMNSDHQRKKILKDLEEKLGRTETKAEQYDAKFAHSTKILGSLKDGIHSIFSNIGCNMTGVSEVLGTGGVTEGNIMTYLGLIEQRANEMLAVHNQIMKQREGEESRATAAMAPGPQSAAGATHINILPPTTGDEYEEEEESDDEEETRPLTREELKARAQKQMTKKEASAKKKSRSKTKAKG